jgi:hypothetical protein
MTKVVNYSLFGSSRQRASFRNPQPCGRLDLTSKPAIFWEIAGVA